MKQFKKRLERLEATVCPDSTKKDEANSLLRAAAEKVAAVQNERLFQDWRKSRVVAGLPADREIWDAKKAEEEATESAALQSYLEKLSADDRAKFKASRFAEAQWRWNWRKAKRYGRDRRSE